ncbi:sulfite oxidase heme-binding subunit YedZ [Segnochrobactrum spirostomi]|uniref:Protein-methionine-sulfoxide reductase heme-binding subunit MsrQ n=1 Tax=Segnochrobactrum spirostomi TaxID=2608987 RepID=A0A6A7Y5I1_9HYPH|nr:ferric reductase-like transmembrane domain-containing protein [Segnochrobactrum spirostomi]MQT14463.1 sulfoxide reductase heme-binding subunit YedZ [Segnochrobactrum spirostomi]
MTETASEARMPASRRGAPWLDRGGSFSPFKTLVFVLLFLPGLDAAYGLATSVSMPGGGALLSQARPLTIALHEVGDWAIRLLLIALAITPMMRILRRPRLLQVRRMIGVAAFVYVAAHLILYIVDQKFDLLHVASEIALRFYLTIGFVALLGLAVLAATSTDGMIERLGAARWQALHRWVYPLTAIGIFHYYLQSKINVTQPVLMTGFFYWLMLYRLLGMKRLGRFAVARRPAGPPVAWLIGLAVASGLAMAFTEALWYALATGVDPVRVLSANLSTAVAPRPAWVVFAAGLAVAVASVVAGLQKKAAPPRVATGRRA